MTYYILPHTLNLCLTKKIKTPKVYPQKTQSIYLEKIRNKIKEDTIPYVNDYDFLYKPVMDKNTCVPKWSGGSSLIYEMIECFRIFHIFEGITTNAVVATTQLQQQTNKPLPPQPQLPLPPPPPLLYKPPPLLYNAQQYTPITTMAQQQQQMTQPTTASTITQQQPLSLLIIGENIQQKEYIQHSIHFVLNATNANMTTTTNTNANTNTTTTENYPFLEINKIKKMLCCMSPASALTPPPPPSTPPPPPQSSITTQSPSTTTQTYRYLIFQINETTTAPLVFFALSKQTLGGTLICLMDMPYNNEFMDEILYLLSYLYEKTFIVKLPTSNQFEYQYTIICKKRKIKLNGNEEWAFSVPLFFKQRIDDVFVQITQKQIETVHQFYNQFMLGKVNVVMERQIHKCVAWCMKYNVPYWGHITIPINP